jgi:hypothetical protein
MRSSSASRSEPEGEPGGDPKDAPVRGRALVRAHPSRCADVSRRTRRHDGRQLALLAVAAGVIAVVWHARRRADAGIAGTPVRWWEIARGPHGVTEP